MFGLSKILGVVFKPIIDWISHKQAITEAKRQTEMTIELEKQKVISEQATADIRWNDIMAKNSGSSWKDEFWTIVLSIPAIGAFIPGADIYINQGFNTLANMPPWYIGALLTAIASAFGRSELIKWRSKMR